MKTLKPFASFFYTLMVVFLLMLDVNLSFAASIQDSSDDVFFYSKNSSQPAQADGQFLYEEKETEKDDELLDSFVFFFLSVAPVTIRIEDSEQARTKEIPKPKGGVVENPLYLTERSLRI